jgi:hypothetical protein
MKVGDLVMYKGDPNIIGLITGSHITVAYTISAKKHYKLWHIHWVVDGGYDVELLGDPVTHEEERVLEVFYGQDQS